MTTNIPPHPDPTFDEVAKHILVCYPHLPTEEHIQSISAGAPISRQLLSRLDQQDINNVTARIPPEHRWKLSIRGERETMLVNAAAALLSQTASKVGLPTVVPPPNIHRMQTGDPLWRGDLYSANMIAEALDHAQLPLVNGQGNILDFGCSSGSLLRVLAAAYPDTSWYGVDPVASSIGWAKANIANAVFSQSRSNPPLQFPDQFLDGAIAVSIWSHYSESAARRWLAEMARLIKPGGFVVFTYHSIYTLLWMCRRNISTPDAIMGVLNALCTSGHYFVPAKIEAELGFDPDWGQAYMTTEWLRAHTLSEWKLLYLANGRNQFNQDIVVMSRL